VWISEAEKVPTRDIAQKLGLISGRSGSFGPCPACGAERRGSSDKRGPIGFRRDDKGWKCHSCGTAGSGIDLVAVRLCGMKFKDADGSTKDRVGEWFSGPKSITSPMPKPTKKSLGDFPPQEEVVSLWKRSSTLSQLSNDHEVFTFLKSRNLHLVSLAQTGIARVTPERKDYQWPKWWPGGRAVKWRLIVPAFDAKGNFRSLHARAIKETAKSPKTLWPSGFQAGGLFMPNRSAIKMMRGEQQELDGLLFVEGITDFIKATTEAKREGLSLAIVGGTSGSFSAVGKMKIPDGIKIYIGTDPDQKGDSYATTIQTQLGSRNAFRLPLRSVDGGDGARH